MSVQMATPLPAGSWRSRPEALQLGHKDPPLAFFLCSECPLCIWSNDQEQIVNGKRNSSPSWGCPGGRPPAGLLCQPAPSEDPVAALSRRCCVCLPGPQGATAPEANPTDAYCLWAPGDTGASRGLSPAVQTCLPRVLTGSPLRSCLGPAHPFLRGPRSYGTRPHPSDLVFPRPLSSSVSKYGAIRRCGAGTPAHGGGGRPSAPNRCARPRKQDRAARCQPSAGPSASSPAPPSPAPWRGLRPRWGAALLAAQSARAPGGVAPVQLGHSPAGPPVLGGDCGHPRGPASVPGQVSPAFLGILRPLSLYARAVSADSRPLPTARTTRSLDS